MAKRSSEIVICAKCHNKSISDIEPKFNRKKINASFTPKYLLA